MKGNFEQKENRYDLKVEKETFGLIKKIKEKIGNFSDETIINVALSRQLEFLSKEMKGG